MAAGHHTISGGIYVSAQVGTASSGDTATGLGLTADVDIETARHEKVLAVPSQAVLGRPVDDLPQALRDLPEVDHSKTLVTVVYRMVDGKAVVTPVKVGPSDITHTLVESGLREGDQVIVGPYKVLEGLANDTKVKDEKSAD